MKSEEELLKQLAKILALQWGASNEAEAAAAAGHLSRLLAKHNLDMSDVEGVGEDAPTIEEYVEIQRSGGRWRTQLALALSHDYFVTVLTVSTGGALCWVGRPVNVEAMKLAYNFLEANIVNNAKWSRPKAENGLTWQNGFGHGAVRRIKSRLRLEREDRAGALGALVVTRKSENDAHIADAFGQLSMQKMQKSRVSYDAVNAGARYADGCRLNNNREVTA